MPPRVQATNAMDHLLARSGLRTPRPRPGARLLPHHGVHLHPSPSLAPRLQLHSHATSDAPSRTLPRTR